MKKEVLKGFSVKGHIAGNPRMEFNTLRNSFDYDVKTSEFVPVNVERSKQALTKAGVPESDIKQILPEGEKLLNLQLTLTNNAVKMLSVATMKAINPNCFDNVLTIENNKELYEINSITFDKDKNELRVM